MKNASMTTMSNQETAAGVLLLPVYVVIIPFLTSVLWGKIAGAYSLPQSDAVITLIANYLAFMAVVVVFRGFLKKSLHALIDNLWGGVVAMAGGYCILFFLSLAVSYLFQLLPIDVIGPNDRAAAEMLRESRKVIVAAAVLLAPVVEEILFRGLIFGRIRQKSRILAYVVSALLFGALHTWQFAIINRDWIYFAYVIQYLPTSVGLAWSYEKSGTVWVPVFFHMALNAFSIWANLA